MKEHASANVEPMIGTARSVYVDRAYSEYCQQIEAGLSVDVSEFCALHPGIAMSLRQAILDRAELERLADSERPWPEVGQVHAGFALDEILGTGGFAQVYLARELSLGGRQVVVKIKSMGFDDEPAILGTQVHAGIVPVHSVQHVDGRTVLCMPYLGRATLADVLNGVNRVPPARATIFDELCRRNSPTAAQPTRFHECTYVDAVLTIAAEFMAAVAALHEQAVCHRDLKPSNLLLCFDGSVRILDFNLAVNLTRPRTPLGGTIPYMAPEQIRNYGSNCTPAADASCDIYAFGVVLFELLAGRLPWPIATNNPESRSRLLAAQLAGPPDLHALNPAVTPEVQQLVVRCLAIEPSDRPTATEVESALLAIRAPAPVASVRRRHRRATYVTAACVLTGCLIIAGAAFRADRSAAWRSRVNAAMLAEDWPAVISASDTLLAHNPSDRKVLLVRGVALANLQRWTEAKLALGQADPDQTDPVAQTWAGYVACRDHDFHSAVAFLRGIADDVKGVADWNNLGLAYDGAKRGLQALEYFQNALAEPAQAAVVHYNRMNALRKLFGKAPRAYAERCLEEARLVLAATDIPDEAFINAAELLVDAATQLNINVADELLRFIGNGERAVKRRQALGRRPGVVKLLNLNRLDDSHNSDSAGFDLADWTVLRPRRRPDSLR